MEHFQDCSGQRLLRYRWYSLPVLFALLFTVVGAGVIASAAFKTVRHASLLNHGVRARGIIVRLKDESDTDGVKYRPIVQFTPAGAGASVEFASGETNGQTRWREGGTAAVLYLPGDPRFAEIEETARSSRGPLIMAFVGTVFLLFGGLMARHMTRGFVPTAD